MMFYSLEEDGVMNISVKMYYDHFKWHFEKALKDKARGTRLVFAPFSVAALHTFRDYMMVVNPALYTPPPKQVSGMRGGRRIVWRIKITDGEQFSSAMSDPNRDRLSQGHSGELRSGGAYVCWVPPLTLEVVVIVKSCGKEFGSCSISSGAARLTSLGFSFAPRIPAVKFLAGAQKVCALAVFGIQKELVDENARRAQQPEAPSLTLLPHELLVMASTYL